MWWMCRTLCQEDKSQDSLKLRSKLILSRQRKKIGFKRCCSIGNAATMNLWFFFVSTDLRFIKLCEQKI